MEPREVICSTDTIGKNAHKNGVQAFHWVELDSLLVRLSAFKLFLSLFLYV